MTRVLLDNNLQIASFLKRENLINMEVGWEVGSLCPYLITD